MSPFFLGICANLRPDIINREIPDEVFCEKFEL